MQNIGQQQTLARVIDGFPIPVFAIDTHHNIILWNRALESLTGVRREDVVGTNHQWMAFYPEKRPVLADLLLDGVSCEELEARYPGITRSELLEEVCEAEDFFPNLGKDGKWLRFKASPMRDSDGKIESVVETLQDVTEGKLATKRLVHLNKVLDTIRIVNRHMRLEKDRDSLIKSTCENLTKNRGYYNAWITLMDKSGGFLTAAESGLGKDFLPMLERLKDGQLTECGRRTISSPNIIVTEIPRSCCSDCPLVHMYSGRGAMTARLGYNGTVYGLLCASIPRSLVTDKREQSLFRTIANDIAYALRGIELEEERQKMDNLRMEQAAALAIRAEELQQSRQRMVNIEETVRKDIAQEIHGTVQNRLIVIVHRLSEMERTALGTNLAPELAQLKQDLEQLLHNHLRPISKRLFPSILRRGLVPALQSLGDQFEEVLPVEVKLDEVLVQLERDDKELIPERLRLAVYRVAEEALTNVVKHAKARNVTIEVKFSPGRELRLGVTDSGQGFLMDKVSGGLGLMIMQDYAKVVGGTCIIHSIPGEGTEVAASFPLAKPEAEPAGKGLPSK